MPLAWRLVSIDVRRHLPSSTAAAVAGVIGGALLAVGGFRVGPTTARPLALLLLVSVPAALAAGTDPDQRDEADLLHRLGVRRARIWFDAWLAATAIVTVPAWFGAVAVHASGASGPGGSGIVGSILLAAIAASAGAAITAGSRCPTPTGRSSVRTWAWAGCALGLLVIGSALPALADTGSNFDLIFPIGAFLVLVALILAAPMLIGVAATLLGTVPVAAVRVAAGTLDRNRRAVTVPFVLVAGVVCLLVGESVIGVGLGQREQARRDALDALGGGTVATSADQLVVSRTLGDVADAAIRDGRPFGEGLPPLVPAARLAVPRAVVAPVEALDLGVRAGRPVYGSMDGSGFGLSFGPGLNPVALATPSILEAFDLDPKLAEGGEALVIDPRALRPDGRVRLVAHPDSDAGPYDRLLPGRLIATTTVGAEVPVVLVPASMVPPGLDPLRSNATSVPEQGSTAGPNQLILRFPDRPTDEEISDLRTATDATVDRGDETIDLRATDRTDALDSITIRTSSDAWPFALGAGALGLAAIFVSQLGLAAAHRREDQVLELLGSTRTWRAVIAATRGLLIGLLATTVGAAVAILATALGFLRYNQSGRFQGGNEALAPLPFSISTPVIVALVLLPLAAGVAGATVAVVARTPRRPDRLDR